MVADGVSLDLFIIGLGSNTVMIPFDVFIVCTLLFSNLLASFGLLKDFKSEVEDLGSAEGLGWLGKISNLEFWTAVGEDSSRDFSCSSAAALMMLSISSLISGLDFSVFMDSESETDEAFELWCLPDGLSYRITQCSISLNATSNVISVP